jgi:hypothetical protein
MSTYDQLLEVLADGEWHSEDDLRSITAFPGEWMKELGYEATSWPPTNRVHLSSA